MRYDLVVNTFVKCAFETGKLTVHCGGEMWRPLVDVTDVAKCYLACIQADLKDVGGQIFNLSNKNYRILELAHWVKSALKDFVDVEIDIVDGAYVPMRLRFLLEGDEDIDMSIDVEAAEINVELPDTLFVLDPPAGVTQIEL